MVCASVPPTSWEHTEQTSKLAFRSFQVMTATNVSCFITSRRGRRYSQIKIVVCSLALFDQNPSQSAKPENNHASGLKAVWHGSKFLELAFAHPADVRHQRSGSRGRRVSLLSAPIGSATKVCHIAPGNLGLVSFVQKYGLTYNWLLTGAGPMRSSEYEAIKQTVHP